MAIENPTVDMPALVFAERYEGEGRIWHEGVIDKVWSNGKYITIVVGGVSRFVRDRNSGTVREA